jgi:hypothetical protein
MNVLERRKLLCQLDCVERQTAKAAKAFFPLASRAISAEEEEWKFMSEAPSFAKFNFARIGIADPSRSRSDNHVEM